MGAESGTWAPAADFFVAAQALPATEPPPPPLAHSTPAKFLLLAFIRSYKNVGRARVECLEGCR